MMQHLLLGALLVILGLCFYMMGYLRARMQMSSTIWSPWLEWRSALLKRALALDPLDNRRAVLIETLTADGAAYGAAWDVYEGQSVLRDGAPYTRPEVAA